MSNRAAILTLIAILSCGVVYAQKSVIVHAPEAEDPGPSDVTAPTMVSSNIASNGTTLTLVFDENVVFAGNPNVAGIAIDPSGSDTTIEYTSGEGTNQLVFTSTRSIDITETLTIAYSSTAGDIQDESGNDLATFSAVSVTNNSEQVAPTLQTAAIASSGTSMTLTFSKNVTFAASPNALGLTLSMSGGAANLTYSSGNGTPSLVYAISRTVYDSETGALAYSAVTGDIKDESNNELISFGEFGVTNNSVEVETPSTDLVLNNFNSESTSALPSTWAKNQSAGTGTWIVDATTPREGANGLSCTASANNIRTWAYPPTSGTDNVDVSVDLYTSSSPVGVLARGASLNTSSPTFYEAVCQSSFSVTLYKVVSGTRTQLATLPYYQGFGESNFVGTAKWMRLTLRCNGSNIRVRCYSYEKGQYFRSDGAWGVGADPETWCINVTDTSIASGTGIGVARETGQTAAAYLDGFQATSVSGVDSTPPTVAITSPSGSATLTSTSDVTVSTSGTPVKVEYTIGGLLTHIAYDSPFTWPLDPTIVDDGAQTISAVSVDAAGNRSTAATVSVTVDVGRTLTMPTLSSKKSWAGGLIATVGSGQTFGSGGSALNAQWEDQITNYWDSTVLHAAGLLSQTLTWSPTFSPSRYTNITNIFASDLDIGGSALLDWLEYADANGYDRERVFLHAANDDWSYTVGSWASATNAEKLWAPNSHDGSSWSSETTVGPSSTSAISAVTLPAASGTYYVGYPEKFDRIRWTQTTANSGYTYAIEYPTAVSTTPSDIRTGRVASSWTSLAGASGYTNGTSGFTATGNIDYTPPSDWVASRLQEGDTNSRHAYLYWVRIRCTGAGATRPVGKLTTRGWDGVGDGAGGATTSAVTFTKWGSLTDWNRYRSRIPYGTYGTWRLATNFEDAAMREWGRDYYARIAAANTSYGGFFLDNHAGTLAPRTARRHLRETTLGFALAQGTMTGQLWEAVGSGKWVFPNILGGLEADIIQQIRYAPGYWNEALLRPLEDTVTEMTSASGKRATLATRAAVTNYGSGGVIQLCDLHDSNSPLEDIGSVDTGSEAASTTGFRGDTNLDGTLSYGAGSVFAYVTFTSGSNVGESRQISGYTAATRKFTFGSAFTNTPAHGDKFVIDMLNRSTGAWTAVSSSSHALYRDSGKWQMRRLQEAAVAYYYCCKQTGMRAGLFVDTSNPARTHSTVFFGYDVGTPVDSAPSTAWATGTDAASATYSIFKRDYTNVRVLWRPKTATGSSLADAGISASVSLGGTYKRLQIAADGTLEQGTNITTIQLRNGEGAILVPQP